MASLFLLWIGRRTPWRAVRVLQQTRPSRRAPQDFAKRRREPWAERSGCSLQSGKAAVAGIESHRSLEFYSRLS